MIKGIIFDLDGTLLDTLSDIKDALNKTLKSRGYSELSVEETKKALGNGSRRLVSDAINKDISESLLDEITLEYTTFYKNNNNIKTKPYKNIIETLKILKEKNILMAITSNKFQTAVTDLNNDTFLGLIDVALGESSGVPLKPNPKMVEIALEKLGLEKHEVLYVGDTEVDMQTAINANISSVAVTWGFRTKEELMKLNPKYIIDDIKEILTLI